MSRKFTVIVAVAVLLSTLACNFLTAIRKDATQVSPTTEPLLSSSGIKMSITMAEDVEGDQKNPVNPTSVYNPAATFHAVVSIEGAPENTVFEAVWYAKDVGEASAPNTKIDSTEVTTGGTRNIDFTLQPNKNWPTGTYSVEIYVNGIKESEASFSVK